MEITLFLDMVCHPTHYLKKRSPCTVLMVGLINNNESCKICNLPLPVGRHPSPINGVCFAGAGSRACPGREQPQGVAPTVADRYPASRESFYLKYPDGVTRLATQRYGTEDSATTIATGMGRVQTIVQRMRISGAYHEQMFSNCLGRGVISRLFYIFRYSPERENSNATSGSSFGQLRCKQDYSTQ
jgi:hypothetical protein